MYDHNSTIAIYRSWNLGLAYVKAINPLRLRTGL